MSEFPLHTRRVAIVGLGLMGGSLAMALRDRVAGLYAVDPDPRTRALAREWGLVDVVAARPEEVLPHVDAVILAAPVQAIVDLIPELPRWMPQPALVLDLGSTKQAVCQALAHLPPRFDVMGGHPIAGKERGGLAQADPGLFRGAPFVFTPLPRTSPRARAFAETLARAVGAYPVWATPEEHDRGLAFTSHLPYLLGVALTRSVPAEMRDFIGPGFRSTSRLVGSSPRLMRDIMATNLDAILEALERAEDELAVLRRLLRQGRPDEWEHFFEESAAYWRFLLGEEDAPPGF
ncbi:MAG: prephenate dehydrogenase [Chloroflexi bacterium]|nr:prephenate dehydrogenase [Chloroflexota bacterium]